MAPLWRRYAACCLSDVTVVRQVTRERRHRWFYNRPCRLSADIRYHYRRATRRWLYARSAHTEQAELSLHIDITDTSSAHVIIPYGEIIRRFALPEMINTPPLPAPQAATRRWLLRRYIMLIIRHIVGPTRRHHHTRRDEMSVRENT